MSRGNCGIFAMGHIAMADTGRSSSNRTSVPLSLRNLSEVGARHFSLRDNPQLLFRPPTTATLDTSDDLHANHCPTIFATLLRAPLESEAVGQGCKAVVAGRIPITGSWRSWS